MLGCNDHPTTSQFLISIITLGFQNLAKSPSHGNVSSGVLRNLIGAEDAMGTKSQKRIDELLDIRNLSEAHEVLSGCRLDNTDMVVQASDSRLIYYVGGYVARKSIATQCAQSALHNSCDRTMGHLQRQHVSPMQWTGGACCIHQGS